jgi:alpha-L-rhamnosidase
MLIYALKTNHLVNPLGFALNTPRLSFKVKDSRGQALERARVTVALDAAMANIVSDSGWRGDIDSLSYAPALALSPRTRYYWRVEAVSDAGESAASETAWFETGKMDEPWHADWITAPIEGNKVFQRTFTLDKQPARARIYATGLGLYEIYINGEKLGDELLAPLCTQYDKWVQVFTYEPALEAGENRIAVMTGRGWFGGRFGFNTQGIPWLFSGTQAIRLELRIEYADGTETVLATGEEGWFATESPVLDDSIYDGETYDPGRDLGDPLPAAPCPEMDARRLMDRLSPPVRVIERLKPAQIFTARNGETVLDLGQEITGYLEFRTEAPKGAKLSLYHGEILQEGNFFNLNYRSAKAEYHYISDGQPRAVRPFFTFYGFRYVKLVGFESPQIEDFAGCVVHSDIEMTSHFESSNPLLNRFAQNALWGQRGNFLDVPTDCPQRDERMGWTGDAQAFSGTACFQMDSQAFFDKYLYDMAMEQALHDGAVPHTVPSMPFLGTSACAWADAATIIPWTNYLFYGDKALLQSQYPVMRDWVDWLYRNDEAHGGARLWRDGFHYADWLALDTKDGSNFGGTDPYFIASSYYYYSTSLLVKAAEALENWADADKYGKLLDEIGEALLDEYFTPGGRLAETSQTAYVCALFMGYAPAKCRKKLAELLEREFERAKGKLRTGFVGTAYLCRVLSQAGNAERAYALLLKEDMPSWLYEVKMGATTVWERWDSVLPDGRLSDLTMNSLNHYAYGAVMEWVYRDVAGINPVEDAPGFRRALIRPRPDRRLPKVAFTFESPVGQYLSAWEMTEERFTWQIEIPFGATAKVVFPFADRKAMGEAYPQYTFAHDGDGVYAELGAGRYTFAYPIE